MAALLSTPSRSPQRVDGSAPSPALPERTVREVFRSSWENVPRPVAASASTRTVPSVPGCDATAHVDGKPPAGSCEPLRSWSWPRRA